MHTTEKEQLSTGQSIIVLVNYMLAAGVFTLPRTTVEQAQTPDVWLSVILGGLLSMVTGLIIAWLGRRFPGQTFFQYIRKIVGWPIGMLLGFILIGYLVCIASFEMRMVQEVTSFFLLEGTPLWAIAGLFMWVSLYLCSGGISAVSRMCRVIVPITWTVFIVVCLLSLQIFDMDNLRPVLGEGMGPVWRSFKPTALTFTSGEALLFMMAFMEKPKQSVRVVVSSTLITMMFYIMAVVLCIGAFSTEGVVTRTWPFIDLIRSFEVKYLIFERFESLWLAIWIMQIFCTFSIAFYGAALGLSQLTRLDRQRCLFILLPMIYIVTEIPRNLNGLFDFGTGIGNFSILLFGMIPLPLLLLARLRRAGS
ncbi:GerAB/ArcD/ProY family transporter [Paenibacillus filicis]|uniref:GerAB/ArcD/ProY family transporter n=1 Tax=Paenibacillus filicis TaxID=669464 RepID=A0ABU9DNS6_9BACL